MTEQEYNALPGLRATAIKAGATSMLHMRAAVTGAIRRESPALAWGATVHGAVLEPERFWRGVATWMGGAKRGKEWTDFKAANDGKTILEDNETAYLDALIDAVYSKPEAADLLLATEHEVVRHWTDPLYGAGKARLDGIGKRAWIELKTARAVDQRRFCSQFYSLGYDLQCGWYSIPPDVAALPCYVIAVESAPPYDVVVYPIPEAVLLEGREKAIAIAKRYRICETAGVYPGADGGEGYGTFVKPAWAGGVAVETEIGTGETMEGGEL
jgi:hypothetical protein